MKNIKYFIGILTFLNAGVLPLMAEAVTPDKELDELLSLDLEALTVSVASKSKENVYDAPSVVSVITADDIHTFGGRNLRDILERQTSLQFTDSVIMHDSVVSIRGQNFTHGNNHVLFLINGRPFRDSDSGGLVSSLINGFPVDMIEKIEIIRGPGSVLYGSNAYSGVVNITTIASDKIDNAMVSATLGSFDTRTGEAVAAQQAGDINIVVGTKFSEADGWKYNAVDGNNVSDPFRTDNYSRGTTLVADYKNLSINAYHGKNKQQSIPSTNVFPTTYRSDENIFLDVGLNHALFNEDWEINYNITYNGYDRDVDTIKIDDLLGEVNIRGKLTDKLSLLVGGTAENHDALIITTDANTQWYNTFAQLDYQLFGWLNLVSGIQMNKPKGIKRSFSPRLAAIAHFNKQWGMKLLYGEAFRSAYFLETSLNVPGAIAGNPNLKPETIKTTEAQLFYHSSDYNASLTFYHSEMEDLIERTGFPVSFVNLGKVDFDGIELEGKAKLNQALNIIGNLTWQTNEDVSGRDDVTYTPNWMAKVGVAYDENKGYSLGLFNSYFGNPSQVREFTTIVERNPEPGAYHLLTANAEFDIKKIWGNNTMPQTYFSLYADNLFNENIRFPEISIQRFNSIPNHSGRALYGTVKVKF